MYLVVSCMVPNAAYAVSDVCCGDPPSCFCFKDVNDDWKQGGQIKIPSGAQTKGLQFKQPQAYSSFKTKDSCVNGGWVWAGSDGKGECTGQRK